VIGGASIPSFSQQISDASHGVNLGGRPRGLELPSQVMHMDRDGVGFELVIQAEILSLIARLRAPPGTT
jgi:hypothetical protein